MNTVMSPENIDWLFFDIGNTLVDEDAVWEVRIRQLASVLRDHGLPYDESMIRETIFTAAADRAPSPFSEAVKRLVGDENLAREIARLAPYEKHMERLYPESLSTVKHLSDHFSLGIIGNQSPGTATRLQAFGLAPYISVCVASAEEGVAKPDPAIYQLSLKRANCPPERAVMIGDRVDNDIIPAKVLGMKTIRILKGFAQVQQPYNDTELPHATLANVGKILPLFGLSDED